MEDALQESETRFREAMVYAPIGKALVSPEGRFLEVNHSLCEIVGYTEAELKERDFQAMTHPEDLGNYLEHVGRLLAGEVLARWQDYAASGNLGTALRGKRAMSGVRRGETIGGPIAMMIEMLDRTPFVERYAIYNWVEDVRNVQRKDGSLTPAGEAYRDKLMRLPGFLRAASTRSLSDL